MGKTGHSHSVLAISQKGGLANFLGVLHPPKEEGTLSDTVLPQADSEHHRPGYLAQEQKEER